MKLQAEIGDDKLQVEIKRDGDKLFADVDGRKYELEISTPEANVVLLKNENRIFEAVATSGSSYEDVAVSLGGKSFDIKLTDPKRLRASGTDTDHGDGLAEIKSAMPGKVVRLLVEAGAGVAKGDGIVVVEAMKMQNELKSPKDGKVTQIKAAEGQTINAGQVLVIIE